MNIIMRKRIVKVTVLPRSCLGLDYAQGSSVIVGFADIIARGGMWADLAADRVFAQVRIADNGRCIEWPGERDCCADALWLQGREVMSQQRAS